MQAVLHQQACRWRGTGEKSHAARICSLSLAGCLLLLLAQPARLSRPCG